MTRNADISANLPEGLAKYYIHFGMNDFTIDQSFNSSSVTDEGTGHALLNFTNNMSAVRYSFSGYTNNYSSDDNFSSSGGYGLGIDYDAGTVKSATSGMGAHAYHTSSIDTVLFCAQTFGALA